jgi:ACT domain-containing protein
MLDSELSLSVILRSSESGVEIRKFGNSLLTTQSTVFLIGNAQWLKLFFAYSKESWKLNVF